MNAALKDQEEAYDTGERRALWDVPKIYGVGGKLLDGIMTFYRDVSACVRVGGESLVRVLLQVKVK